MKYPKAFLELQLFVTDSSLSVKACRQGKRKRVQIQTCMKLMAGAVNCPFSAASLTHRSLGILWV